MKDWPETETNYVINWTEKLACMCNNIKCMVLERITWSSQGIEWRLEDLYKLAKSTSGLRIKGIVEFWYIEGTTIFCFCE